MLLRHGRSSWWFSYWLGALGGSQTGQVNQNSLQTWSIIGNDPLTHHLANMSRSQLNQVIHEMKDATTSFRLLLHTVLQFFKYACLHPSDADKVVQTQVMQTHVMQIQSGADPSDADPKWCRPK
ncbi:hypothetical protein SOVF_002710 [Spinacia oleracea]|nr:hypothetical protein SOVF_002710 [Spinacia oleracea]